MRRISIVLASGALVAAAASLNAQSPASFRVLLGVADKGGTRWDGSIKVQSSGQYTLEPWRFEGVDNIDGDQFHISTHRLNQSGPVVANGFVLTVSEMTASSEVALTTAQGDFSFRPAEIPYGKGAYALNGKVYVDRVPAAARLTDTPEEEDYPSLAPDGHGDIWLAFVQFRHSPDTDKLRAGPPVIPKDFKMYAEPTGGDQIWAREYSGGTWGKAVAVTPPGGDLYKTAVAVDGKGRAWVFWSENHHGNFDVFACAIDNSAAGKPMQISTEAGSDIDPVAATDATGRVWVAWQGWRDGTAAIYAAEQESSGFSKPLKVSNSSKDEWNPAIAADKTGRVAIAWDSYRNGNYDVYARIATAQTWGDEIPVAATERYEAYPSIAFDPGGRLWVAYEEGGRGWGRDFGAYVSTGIALYQGRLIKLRGIEPSGSFVNLDASLDAVLIGAPNARVDLTGSQADSEFIDPRPEIALHRAPDAELTFNFPKAPRNTLPRLSVDVSGRIWLAFRTPHPTWRNTVGARASMGTCWSEYLVSFDGSKWTPPIFINHSDNLLDNRPALATLAPGKLLIVDSSDGRRDYSPTRTTALKDPAPDPYNNDLWSQEVDLGAASGAIPVSSRAADTPATPGDANASSIATLRGYHGGPEGNLRVVRGEFHRHSEISYDGGNDGTLLDQWRYILDVAALDWVGCCDHDNGGAREYSWWITQKLTDVFYTPGRFSPMFSYERSVNYPDGHRNVIFAQRGIHPLFRYDIARLATAAEENDHVHTPDTQMLYAYLRQFHGIAASHSSATGMGTDWRDNDPEAEPVVEIYQGLRQSYEMPDGPRSPSEKDAIGGWRPKGFVNVALDKGYRLGFEASSDHVSTHLSYAILYVKDLTRESVLDALMKRHVYAATDDILADVEDESHMMGDEFSTSNLPSLKIKMRGTSNFAKVSIIRNGAYVYTAAPNTPEVDFSWRDNDPIRGRTSYYYVRGEQDNGELVWVSPMWIRYAGN